VATVRTRAASQVCRAAYAATSMGSSTTLNSKGTVGVPRPLAPTRGTEAWTSTSRMSSGTTAIDGSGFPFVASGMPRERMPLQNSKA